MTDAKVINKYGLEFPWNVSVLRGSPEHRNFSIYIRQCELDDIAVLKEKVDDEFLDRLEKIFKEDKGISLYVHSNQFLSFGMSCILLDIAEPIEHAVGQISLAIARKLKPSTFQNKEVEKRFQDLLYSKTNLERLNELGLEINPPEYYLP